MIKKRMVTMYKNNSRFISKFKGCSSLQFLCSLTGKSSEIRNVNLYSPLAVNDIFEKDLYYKNTLNEKYITFNIIIACFWM